jgi:acetyltransferase-like isoleucine patch superfamily enzyme
MNSSLRKLILGILNIPASIRYKLERETILEGFLEIGEHLSFDPLSSVFSERNICIGDNVFIGKNAYITGDITIGYNVMFGANISILAGNHIFAVNGKSARFIKPEAGENSEPVVVEDEVWAGANVTILVNLTIGIGAVIGAGSVVVKDVYPFTISVGNPCLPVRRIFDYVQLIRHLTTLKYTDEFARKVVERRQNFLIGPDLPTIDKSRNYSAYVYQLA